MRLVWSDHALDLLNLGACGPGQAQSVEHSKKDPPGRGRVNAGAAPVAPNAFYLLNDALESVDIHIMAACNHRFRLALT
jgi:hypothetical protein